MSIVKDCCFIVVSLYTVYYWFKYNFLKQKYIKEKRLFINILGHDLRVPIIAQIRGLNLLFKNTSTDQVRIILDEVNKSCEYTIDMVTMLMNIYKIELGEATLIFEKLDLNDCLVKILNEFHNMILSKNIKFSLNINIESICADKKYFIKALCIIINTVTKYCENNTTVAVTSYKYSNNVGLKIEYIGHSISNEEYSRMFELNPTYSAVGQGIQMYLLKRIVDLHHGEINFSPQEQQHNEFDIHLPAFMLAQGR